MLHGHNINDGHNFLSGFYTILYIITKRRFFKGEREITAHRVPLYYYYYLCRFRLVAAALLEFSAPCAMTLGAVKEKKIYEEARGVVLFCYFFIPFGSGYRTHTHRALAGRQNYKSVSKADNNI